MPKAGSPSSWPQDSLDSDRSCACLTFEALAQRITIRFALRGFERDATRLYLEHRLKIAGLDRPLFTAPANEALFDASQGVMRRIDTLAHHALAAAATARAKLVEPEHILHAARGAALVNAPQDLLRLPQKPPAGLSLRPPA